MTRRAKEGPWGCPWMPAPKSETVVPLDIGHGRSNRSCCLFTLYTTSGAGSETAADWRARCASDVVRVPRLMWKWSGCGRDISYTDTALVSAKRKIALQLA